MIVRNLLLRSASRRIIAVRPPPRFFATTTTGPPAEPPSNARDAQHYASLQNVQSSEAQDQHQSIPIAGFADIRPVPAASEGSEWGIPESESKQVQDYIIKQYQRQTTSQLGTKPSPGHKPIDILLHPPSAADVTLEMLLACGAHLGHKPSHWNPGNSAYIFGVRDGIHVLSLEAIAAHLRRAARVVEGVALRGGLILFAGTRLKQLDAVVRAAAMVRGCHLYRQWQPGTLTNGEALLARCRVKVVNELDDDVPGFEEQLRKRGSLKPDLVVCLNPMENHVLLRECAIHGIPTVGIVDTNMDPSLLTYPMPGNDDSLRFVQTVAMVLARAGQAGNEARLQLAREGVITFNAAEGLMPLMKRASK